MFHWTYELYKIYLWGRERKRELFPADIVVSWRMSEISFYCLSIFEPS